MAQTLTSIISISTEIKTAISLISLAILCFFCFKYFEIKNTEKIIKQLPRDERIKYISNLHYYDFNQIKNLSPEKKLDAFFKFQQRKMYVSIINMLFVIIFISIFFLYDLYLKNKPILKEDYTNAVVAFTNDSLDKEIKNIIDYNLSSISISFGDGFQDLNMTQFNNLTFKLNKGKNLGTVSFQLIRKSDRLAIFGHCSIQYDTDMSIINYFKINANFNNNIYRCSLIKYG